MRRCLLYGLTTIASFALIGCGLDTPRLRAPGYIYQQQLRATFHDPYAAPDVAPEVFGGRPRTFWTPRSQEVQAQWELDQRL